MGTATLKLPHAAGTVIWSDDCGTCPRAKAEVFPCGAGTANPDLSQTVLDAVPAMMAVLDCDGVIRTVNQAWRQFGESNGSTDPCKGVGSNYLEICDRAAPKVPEAGIVAAAIRAVLGGEREQVETEYACRGDNTMKWFQLSVKAIRDERFRGVITMHTDMTARRQAEALVLASERVAVAGRMAATIAHEVNNPLAGIKNAFALVKGGIDPKHPAVGFVPLIESEIDRIGKIVRQLLDMHRRDKDVPRRVDLGEAAGDVVMFLTPNARTRNVRLRVIAPAERCIAVLCDSGIRQVLYNLIQNAIDASPENGEVRVLVGHGGSNSVFLEVADHGAGIPQDVKENIFEPFFTTKGKGPSSGMGLGLAVCRSLVDAMSGTIEVDTIVGSGTTFRVVLPTGEGAAHEQGQNSSRRR